MIQAVKLGERRRYPHLHTYIYQIPILRNDAIPPRLVSPNCAYENKHGIIRYHKIECSRINLKRITGGCGWENPPSGALNLTMAVELHRYVKRLWILKASIVRLWFSNKRIAQELSFAKNLHTFKSRCAQKVRWIYS